MRIPQLSLFILVVLSNGFMARAQDHVASSSASPRIAGMVEIAAREPEALPENPQPQDQSNQEGAKISASGKLPAVLAPETTRQRLTAHDKFVLYVHQAFSPFILVGPAFGAAITMASPPDHYPREWKDGAEAYGRLFGDYLAREESQRLAQVVTVVALHEDPRYLPSTSHNPFARTVYAISFTLVDRSDSGHAMPAFSNYIGAAASGFVGNAYLPPGYNNVTHAGQRSAIALASFAGGYIANEFCPEWGPVVEKLHIPLVHPPCEERIRAKQP